LIAVGYERDHRVRISLLVVDEGLPEGVGVLILPPMAAILCSARATSFSATPFLR
jgi:hypothetical protein